MTTSSIRLPIDSSRGGEPFAQLRGLVEALVSPRQRQAFRGAAVSAVGLAISFMQAPCGVALATGAVIYTTFGHPCPMCATACYWAGLDRIYYGSDPAAITDAGMPAYGKC